MTFALKGGQGFQVTQSPAPQPQSPPSKKEDQRESGPEPHSVSRAGPRGPLRSPPKNWVRRGAECREQARPEMMGGPPSPSSEAPSTARVSEGAASSGLEWEKLQNGAPRSPLPFQEGRGWA